MSDKFQLTKIDYTWNLDDLQQSLSPPIDLAEVIRRRRMRLYMEQPSRRPLEQQLREWDRQDRDALQGIVRRPGT